MRQYKFKRWDTNDLQAKRAENFFVPHVLSSCSWNPSGGQSRPPDKFQWGGRPHAVSMQWGVKLPNPQPPSRQIEHWLFPRPITTRLAGLPV